MQRFRCRARLPGTRCRPQSLPSFVSWFVLPGGIVKIGKRLPSSMSGNRNNMLELESGDAELRRSAGVSQGHLGRAGLRTLTLQPLLFDLGGMTMRRMIYSVCAAAAVLVPNFVYAAQSADEQAVAQWIGAQLKDSGQLQNYRIGVNYRDGVAKLSGTVANHEQLATAVRLTRRLGGVDRVVNNLTVEAGQRAGEPSNGPDGDSLELGQSLQQASQQSRGQRPAPGAPRMQGMQSKQRSRLASAQMPAAPPQRAQPMRRMAPQRPRSNTPRPIQAPVRQAMAESYGPMQANCPPGGGMGQRGMGPGGMGPGGQGQGGMMMGGQQGPMPAGHVTAGHGGAVNYDNAQMPGYAWPSYASYPNYAALTYPQQYSPSAWPYIGPFYPYPQVPLGWRKVALEWDDGWWFLDFSSNGSNH